MPLYKVEITRRFYITDEVLVEAQSIEDANDKAWKEYDTLKSELPSMIFDWLNFEESDVFVEGEAEEGEI